MKKKIILALLAACTIISTTGCSNIFNKDEPVQSTESTESTELYSSDTESFSPDTESVDYYDETLDTEAFSTEASTDSITDDYLQSDQSVYSQAVVDSAKYYKKEDTFEVAITDDETQQTVNADFRADVWYSDSSADMFIKDFNKNNTDFEIDTATTGTEYKVLDFTLSTVGKNAPISVSTDLVCTVVGINGVNSTDTNLYYNNANYKGGEVIYAKTETLNPDGTASGSIVYCVPEGCTDYGLQLGDNETVLIPENDALVDTFNNDLVAENYDVSGAYID